MTLNFGAKNIYEFFIWDSFPMWAKNICFWNVQNPLNCFKVNRHMVLVVALNFTILIYNI